MTRSAMSKKARNMFTTVAILTRVHVRKGHLSMVGDLHDEEISISNGA